MTNGTTDTAFARYVGIDYSGAETPTASLKGLRVYVAQGDAPADEVLPPPSPRKYWTRRGVAQWLIELLSEDVPTLVGIDHGFSFPLRYFETHHLLPDWSAFLDDFRQHWPTDEDHVYVDFVRDASGVLAACRARSDADPDICHGPLASSRPGRSHSDIMGRCEMPMLLTCRKSR